MDSSNSKRVMIVGVVKPRWLKRPMHHWPLQRFLVCDAVDADQLPELLTRFVDIDDAFGFVEIKNFNHVEQGAYTREGSESDDEEPHVTVTVTRSVLRELGLSVVEVVVIGKSGRPAPSSKQLPNRYWVISLRENKVVSMHPSLWHAYSAVSVEYQRVLNNNPANPNRRVRHG